MSLCEESTPTTFSDDEKRRIDNVLSKDLHPALVKTRTQGKEVFIYIDGATVLEILNVVFSTFGWSFVILEKSINYVSIL